MGEPGSLLGWEAFQRALHAAGALPCYATPAWAENAFRWVVWKLARVELAAGPAAAGRLLTAPVALDELRYRCACCGTVCAGRAAVRGR